MHHFLLSILQTAQYISPKILYEVYRYEIPVGDEVDGLIGRDGELSDASLAGIPRTQIRAIIPPASRLNSTDRGSHSSKARAFDSAHTDQETTRTLTPLRRKEGLQQFRTIFHKLFIMTGAGAAPLPVP